MARDLLQDDCLDALHRQNPWHQLGLAGLPDELAPPVERALAPLLAEQKLEPTPMRFQVVLGPRRVGKSTICYQVARHMLEAGIRPERLWWLRLDHPVLLRQELGTLVSGLLALRADDEPLYLFLDELAYAADWDLWLKTFFDERWPVRILATSSSTMGLRRRRLESGAGRWEEHHLSPWLFSEYLRLAGAGIEIETGDTLAATIDRLGLQPSRGLEQHLRRLLLIGGFPELLTAAPRPDEVSELLRSQRVLRSDAVERTIYKDIPQAFSIGEPPKLERLLCLLGGQLAGVLSPNTLATDLGLTQPTVDKYLDYLVKAFLLFALHNYSASEEAVQRRGRKLYFVDGAVRNAALERGTAPLLDDGELGLLRENAAAAHLQALGRQTGVRLYHWRQARKEVDLVYDHPERPLAFEVASSQRHGTAGLVAFRERFPRFAAGCFLVYPDAPFVPPKAHPSGIGRLPLALLLAAIGAQAERALARRVGP